LIEPEISSYSKYEVVAYNSVKAIYPTSEGLTFQTDAAKAAKLIVAGLNKFTIWQDVP